jgi:hypothetical protein
MPRKPTPSKPEPPKRRKRGFETAGALLAGALKAPAEKRGFGEAKLLTHWPEIVGEDVAAIARPVKITYGRGFGGTLVLLTTGANAPVLDMQKDRIMERVNATCGYRAVAHVHITQTAPTGFAEGQVSFQHRAPKTAPRAPDPAAIVEARRMAAPVADAGLRAALEALAQNVLSKSKR